MAERVYVALGSNLGDRAGHLAHARARLAAELEPAELLRHLHAIEVERGRVRTVRWGPRTLDLDIVRYGGRAVREAELTIPHPELPNRDFWLREIAELDALPEPTTRG